MPELWGIFLIGLGGGFALAVVTTWTSVYQLGRRDGRREIANDHLKDI